MCESVWGKHLQKTLSLTNCHFKLLQKKIIFFPQKLQLEGLSPGINIWMSHSESLFLQLLSNAVRSMFLPSSPGRNTVFNPSSLLSANMAALPWKETISFSSDSCQIRQIYSLALKNFNVCQENSSSVRRRRRRRPHCCSCDHWYTMRIFLTLCL